MARFQTLSKRVAWHVFFIHPTSIVSPPPTPTRLWEEWCGTMSITTAEVERAAIEDEGGEDWDTQYCRRLQEEILSVRHPLRVTASTPSMD